MKKRIIILIVLCSILFLGCKLSGEEAGDESLEKRKNDAIVAQIGNVRMNKTDTIDCTRCGMPWNKCEVGEGVELAENIRVTALCQWCEDRTIPEEQVEHYYKFFLRYLEGIEKWLEIKEAVLAQGKEGE